VYELSARDARARRTTTAGTALDRKTIPPETPCRLVSLEAFF
jgi:hypothetical protein